ncbi:MAG: hypothetical protein CMJ75_22885 [Planctomycetaceae bacterium]|nr:hypothetical protein [Planctomycetaceae bacterium]
MSKKKKKQALFRSYDLRGNSQESESPALVWGWQKVPHETTAAWGARAIATPGGLDLLPDRQSLSWRSEEERSRLVGLLNGGALEAIQETYAFLRQTGGLRDDQGEDVVLYDGPDLKAMGSTQGSCGYFYVAAWLKEAS